MTSAVTSRTPPLAGITVVSLEQAVAAPICSRILADFGARVIKVENPRGGDFARYYDDVVGGQAAHFVWANRGKESIALDLKNPEGIAVMRDLLDRADVFVSNLGPGATSRLGIGPGDLVVSHPHLISMEIDGYGQGGPLSHKRAYDVLVQAEAGVCAITGHPGAPAKPGPPVADFTTGLYAATSILAMLCGRSQSGAPIGGSAAVSLFDTMTELMGYPLNWSRHTGQDQEPIGVSSPAVAPYGAYATRDAQTVVLGTTNDQEWQRLALQIIGRPDLAEDPALATNSGRVARRADLDDVIAQWCLRHDLTTIQARADEATIGNSRLNQPTEVVSHLHLSARDRWRQVATPGGLAHATLPPAIIAGFEPPMGAVPALGEHSLQILAELGRTPQEVARLAENGVVGVA